MKIGAEHYMIITHKLSWDKCLSHKIFPLIEKGWKDVDRKIHFLGV